LDPGNRLFIGLAVDTTALITADPSSKLNTLGFAVDSADTAISFYIMMVLMSQLKTLLSDNQPYLVIMLMMRIFCKPNDTTVFYRLDDVSSGLTIIDINSY
jgi:hypothetical protein